MSSNLNNKALRNIKVKDNENKINCSESEINELLKKSFEYELKNLLKTIRSARLIANKLYEFLIKFENNLPRTYFYKNVMKIGDVLLKNSYASIAKNQCYERYLVKVHKLDILNGDLDLEQILLTHLNLEEEEQLELTVMAIFGTCLSEFQCIEILDSRFRCKSNQQISNNLLLIIQRVIEAILKMEKYCWLVHNGTVWIYSICRKLIQSGNSMIALEPLIWASCCLETSVPLLNVSNLKWRSTIYTAVCEALFNLEMDMEAEAFARRGLSKINQLHEVYLMSPEIRNLDDSSIFCEATLRMGVMIFRRTVFESRRRPKSYLKPRTKVNFKEILQANWPRTGTERILAEMFETPSQQILAVLEALRQPSRTIGKMEPPASDTDWEILDVYAELFHATNAIITGKISMTGKPEKGVIKPIRILDTEPNVDQLTLAIRGGADVTIKSCFEITCWAFSYKNWEFLDNVIEPLLTSIKESKYVPDKIQMQNTLNLFLLMRKTYHYSTFIEKKTVKVTDQANEEERSKSKNLQRSLSAVSKDSRYLRSKGEMTAENMNIKERKTDSKHHEDPLYQLADFIENLLDKNFELKHYSKEILMEAGSILWTKCKSVFQTTHDGVINANQIRNPNVNIEKFICILYGAHRVLSITNFAEHSLTSYSELSLRFGILLQHLSSSGGCQNSEKDVPDSCFKVLIESLKTPEMCITIAKKILKESINQLNRSRSIWSLNREYGTNDQPSQSSSIEHISDDLYLEINSLFLRICAREIFLSPENNNLSQIKKSGFYLEALRFCNKNLILLALFQAHLANFLKHILPSSELLEIVQYIKSLVERSENNLSDQKTGSKPKIENDNIERLPPPVVIKKGSDYIEVCVDSNIPEALKSKVEWCRLYARPVDTPNAEVRLTDDKLPGTGMEVSKLSSKFVIYQLTPHEQYILAFAAFDKFGSLIGRSIGCSTKKILATDFINRANGVCTVTQVLFEIGLTEPVVAFENSLWETFIEPDKNSEETFQRSPPARSSSTKDYLFKPDFLDNSSPMLLRQFCLLVLSSVDCECRLGRMTNDIDNHSPSQIRDQMHRLRLAKKLLALFVISKKLKDPSLTIEIFTSICRLLVPIMNNNQFYGPFSEILITGINTVHSLPQTTWIKIPASLKVHTHHLLACAGFYLLKYFSNCQLENELPVAIGHSVTILLQMSGNSPFPVIEQEDGVNTSDTNSLNTDTEEKANAQRKVSQKLFKSNGISSSRSSQQIAFEHFKLSLSKKSLGDHQLTGTEEPDILMAYINNLPSKIAYKEVTKFSRKHRYLQFIVEILHKSVTEGNLEHSINYYKDIKEWLRKRNETVLGRRLAEDNRTKEANKNKDEKQDSRRPPKMKRKMKYETINVHDNMTETQRQLQEQAELKALEVLSLKFCPRFSQILKQRRFRMISASERESRIKMNCSTAMAYLGIALAKIDCVTQLLNAGYRFSEVPEMEDITKFMLDGTGKILPLEDISLIEENIPVLKTTKRQASRQVETPRTFRSEMNNFDKRCLIEVPKFLSQYSDSLTRVALLIKRAVVLATRGKLWVSLSRACSIAWFSLTLVINTSCRLSKFIELAKKECFDIDWSLVQTINLKNIFAVFSPLCFSASEAMLDLHEDLTLISSETVLQNFDQTFMENFVLRSVHLLFETGNYEKVIHTILRFTRLSNFTFVNATHPILIEAQRHLSTRTKTLQDLNSGLKQGDRGQQCMNQVLQNFHWTSLDSSNYWQFLEEMHNTQIPITKLLGRHSEMDNSTNDQPNPPKQKSKVVFVVPTNFLISEKEWKQSSNQRSSKTLWLELYQKKNYFLFLQNSRSFSNNDFPKISIHELLTCYKELLDQPFAENNPNYYSLLLRDMGDLYIDHLEKLSLSLPLWHESLDIIFNEKCCVNSLKILLLEDGDDKVNSFYHSEKLLSKYGVETCLIIGSTLTRLARFDKMPEDERVNLLLQSGLFFKALYNSSLAHPDHDIDYLSHSLTLDPICQTPLILKHHLFSSGSVLNITDIESQLIFLLNTLVSAGYYEFSIPLLALYEHIVYTFCRNFSKCIEAQIIKLKICIKLRLFSTASRVIFQLLTGDRLPQLIDSTPAATFSKTSSNIYNDDKPINDERNLLVIDKIMSRRINPNFAEKIGAALSDKISLLQSEFLIELSLCIPVSPETIDPDIFSSFQSTTPKKSAIKKSEKLGIQTEDDSQSVLDIMSSKLQLLSSKEIDLPTIKGLMLHISSNITQPMTEEFLASIQRDNLQVLKMTLSEVEIVLHGLLIQAKNCRARQCNRSGARIAMFDCKLFNDYLREFAYPDARLLRTYNNWNIFVHMNCNQEIIECLLEEISCGNVMEIAETTVPDLPPLKDLIMSCITECDEYGLVQYKSWFVAALGQYVFMSGYEIEKYMGILQENQRILEHEPMLSFQSENSLIETRLRLLNLRLSSCNGHGLHDLGLLKMELGNVYGSLLKSIDNSYPKSVLWNRSDRDLSQVEIRNIYDERYLNLCQTNLLFAALAMEATKFMSEKTGERIQALSHLNTGLSICRSLSRREPWVETEFLLLLGRVQRYLLSCGKVSPSTAISTLIEGLKLLVLSSGHLGLRNQFFLELSLTFMSCSRLYSESFDADGMVIQSANVEPTAPFKQVPQSQLKLLKKDAENFQHLSRLSLKCANLVSDCIRDLNMLKSHSFKAISTEAENNLPVPILFDFYAKYLLGDPRIKFRNEIEEEMSRMPECRILRDNEHLEDQIEKLRNSHKETTFSQIFAYQELLLKVCNNQGSKNSDEYDFKLMALTRCVVHSHALFEKESRLHKFLIQHIPEYRDRSMLFIPSELLQFFDLNTLEGLSDMFVQNLGANLLNYRSAEDGVENAQYKTDLVFNYHPGILTNHQILEIPFPNILEVKESEILFQFCNPPFEYHLHSMSQSLLLFCGHMETPAANAMSESMTAGWILVPWKGFLHVHRELQESSRLLETALLEPSSTGANVPDSMLPITNGDHQTFSAGSQISVVENKIRQVFDEMASWVNNKSDVTYSPAQDLLVQSSDNVFSVSSPGFTVEKILFDITRENVQILSNSFNPIFSKPVTNATISKFIRHLLQIPL